MFFCMFATSAILRTDIGIIGLAVMGRNLALNLIDNGFRVSVYNRTTSEEKLLQGDFDSRLRIRSTIIQLQTRELKNYPSIIWSYFIHEIWFILLLEFLDEANELVNTGKIIGASSLPSLVKSLAQPRCILLMISGKIFTSQCNFNINWLSAIKLSSSWPTRGYGY